MAAFNEQLAGRIDRYIESLFVPEDPVLTANIANAGAAGLPAIHVSVNQGKLLYLLARMTRAHRILEIGLLGGYSTTWLGRALPADGRLISLEYEPKHAEVARKNLAAAGIADLVEIRVGDAAVTLQSMVDAGEPPFGFIFIDADKTGYPRYLELALKLSVPGTVIVADNVIRNGSVMEDNPADPNSQGARAYNAVAAAHPRLESIALPILKDKIDGMTISIVK
ncbi:MAG: O-methyltransferase [Acidobacteriota bacterium]|nr:O-methyltransferase [Acidobacteriota bacterium]